MAAMETGGSGLPWRPCHVPGLRLGVSCGTGICLVEDVLRWRQRAGFDGSAHPMRKLSFIFILAAAGYFGLTQYRQASVDTRQAPGLESVDDGAITRALEGRASGIQLQGQGAVIKVLPDDNNGSRHQRFILKLRSGQTLLIAHNIDLAPRIGSLRVGDSVVFNGEYEWNSKGGVVHWTHHDPNGRHAAGWLKHDSRVYQ
jgi:hypothetical protein